MPAINGEPVERTKPIGFEHHGNLVLRDGVWKIVLSYRKTNRQMGFVQCGSDRSELKDLSKERPGKKNELIA